MTWFTFAVLWGIWSWGFTLDSNGHWKILWAPNAQIMNGCQAEHSGGYDWIIPVFSPISSSTYPWVRSDLFIFFTFLMKERFLQRNTEAFLIRCMFIHFDSFLLSFISVACSLQCQICFSRWWCCIAIGSTCLQGNMTAHYTEGWPLKGKR